MDCYETASNRSQEPPMEFTHRRMQKADRAADEEVALASTHSKCQLAQWTYTLLRFAIGAIFVWSGGTKLAAPQELVVIIEAYGLIPEALVLHAALSLSAFELLAGSGLILVVGGSLPAVTGLLLLFMVVLGYGIFMGLDVDCGCFGPGEPEGDAFHGLRPALYRDGVMLAGIGYLMFWRRIASIRPRKLSEFIFFLRKGDACDDEKSCIGVDLSAGNGHGDSGIG